MKIFVSYSTQDVDLARRIAAQLRQEDFLVLRDQEFIEGGQPFNTRIQQVLRGSNVVLLLVSKAASQSHWVNEEVIEAIEQKKRIFPLKLEADAEPIAGTKSFQWLDFTSENQWTLNYPRLVTELKAHRTSLTKTPLPDLLKEETQEIPSIGNPFIVGPRVKAPLFVGRQRALKSLVQHIASAELQSRSIVANKRMGKSSFLTYIHKNCDRLMPAGYAQWVAVYIDMQSARAQTLEGFTRAMRLSLKRDLPEDMQNYLWKESHDGRLGAFEESIEELRAAGIVVLLLLDEWEEVQAHPELNQAVDSLRSLINNGDLALVTASANELSRLHKVSEILMANAGKKPTDTSNIHPLLPTTYLGLMPDSEWQEVITAAFGRSGRDVRASDMRLIQSLAGGNPILTQMAGSLVWEGIDEGWSESEIRALFDERVEQTLRDWWHKEYVEHQQEALRYVLELPFMRDPAPTQNELNTAIHQLKLRGLLNETGEVFAKPFADFIHRLHQ